MWNSSRPWVNCLQEQSQTKSFLRRSISVPVIYFGRPGLEVSLRLTLFLFALPGQPGRRFTVHSAEQQVSTETLLGICSWPCSSTSDCPVPVKMCPYDKKDLRSRKRGDNLLGQIYPGNFREFDGNSPGNDGKTREFFCYCFWVWVWVS